MDDDDLEQAGLPPALDSLAIPLALDSLAPWHRPRKQFVREHQWARYSTEFAAKLSISDRPIKYLTLPGLDYFDVEVISEQLGRPIELTAFQTQATNRAVEARCQIRTDSLVKRGLLTDRAQTFAYPIEGIIRRQSQPYLILKRRGPFDIINLDACGSIANPNRDHKLIEAIHSILEYQFNNKRERWLLFFTADIRREDTCETVLSNLEEAIQINSRNSLEFKERYRDLKLMLGVPETFSLCDGETDRDAFIRGAALGVSKWILHLAASHDWQVNAKGHYCYSTEGEDARSPTMVSLGFEMIPKMKPLEDPVGIASQALPVQISPDYHIKALERVEDMRDLDRYLDENASFKAELARKQLHLLQLAGYADHTQEEFKKQYQI